jgi:hypothetical protein
MRALNDAYLKTKGILGKEIEALESVHLVEKYRRYFKPDNVKVLLLAESHVFTSDNERKITVPPLPALPDYPTQYARFVYCLGYGERNLTASPLHPARDGTPQFWKILFSCCNRASASSDFFDPILSRTPYHQRLQNKIALLKKLKEKGIWLVDTSIVALYNNGTKSSEMFRAIQESWQSYTRDVVLAAQPEHVICIGKGVAHVVEPDLNRHFPGKYTVISQPNAHLSASEHLANFKTYSSICGQ